MLRQAEPDRIYAHLARSVPVAPTGVVADSLHFKNPRPQVPDCVAADYDDVSHRFTYGAIALRHNLHRCLAAVGKVPTVRGELRHQRNARAVQEVEAGKVRLDQFELP